MKNLQSSCAFAITSAVISAFMMPGRAFPITISATAQGSLTPPTALFPNTVTNGDFLITARQDSLVGDGEEERTSWTFDFTQDPNFSVFASAEQLTSAKLTLTLSTCCNIETDEFRIASLPLIQTEVIQRLPSYTIQTIELELLDFYRSDEILDVLKPKNRGTLPMYYFDDSIISFARLELSDDRLQSVPEPSILLGLFTTGAIGFVSQKVRGKN